MMEDLYQMKRFTVILMLTIAIVVSSLTAVSAANTKEEWYGIIDPQLESISDAMLKGNVDEARNLLSNLQKDVYDCARYLAEIGEYKNGEILYVYNLGSRAVLNKGNDATNQIANARNLLAKILLGRSLDSDEPDTPYIPVSGGSTHS